MYYWMLNFISGKQTSSDILFIRLNRERLVVSKHCYSLGFPPTTETIVIYCFYSIISYRIFLNYKLLKKMILLVWLTVSHSVILSVATHWPRWGRQVAGEGVNVEKWTIKLLRSLFLNASRKNALHQKLR